MSGKPRKLGKYQILEKIGAGGMAEVFRAKRDHSDDNTSYAIKMLSEELSRDPLLVSMFVDEARLASQLKHPSIVNLVEFGADETGRVFMVMEHVDGRDLRWCLSMAARAQYWLPVEFSLTILRDLCEALGYAHQAVGNDGHPLQIVHRDVSHSNCFLSKDGNAKLADFGIARARGRQSKTRTGLVKGKLGYLSPEQVRAERLDGRSDLFSLSVVIWELLTQRRMFVGETEFKTMVAVCTEQRIPPSTYRPGLPTTIDQLVLRGVAISRKDRYVDAAEFGRHVEDVAAQLNLQLGHTIVADVLRYLEDCARLYAPEEAARRAIDDDVAPEEVLAQLDKAAHRHTPTPHEDLRTGSFPVMSGEKPSDSFSAPQWANPPRTGSNPAYTDDDDDPIFDLLASRDPLGLHPRPSASMPARNSRQRTAAFEATDLPTYFHRDGEVKALKSFDALIRALDPRKSVGDESVSPDGTMWMTAERVALLGKLAFVGSLRTIKDPIQQGETTGPGTIGVLANLALNGFTGRVVFERGPERFGLLLEGGGVVDIVSTHPAHQWIAALAAAEHLPSDASVIAAFHEVISSDRALDEVLQSKFSVSEAQIDSFQHAAALDILEEIISLDEDHPKVTYACAASDGFPGQKFIAGTPLELMLAASANAWTRGALHSALSPMADQALTFAPGLPLVARMLRLQADSKPFLRALSPGITGADILEQFRSQDDARATAERLLLILHEAGAIATESPSAP